MKVIEFKEVEVDLIKPDSNQPRKYIDEDFVRSLAQSIANVGVLVDIELDRDLMIVTGELRWRAAKIAGLKTIPAKIIEIDDQERFIRQFISNIHDAELSVHEKDEILKKMTKMWIEEGNEDVSVENPNVSKKIDWLSKWSGMPRDFVEKRLIQLEATEGWMKNQRMKKLLNKVYEE